MIQLTNNEFETIFSMIPDLSYIFSLFDTNNDMGVDKDEINKFASEYLGHLDLTPYIEYFHQADTNGDGKIQFKELETFYNNIPDFHIF
jgi:Ca2+-binding EF-hand superfamily protein